MDRILHVDGLTGFVPALHAARLEDHVRRQKNDPAWHFHSYEPDTGRATMIHRPPVALVEQAGPDRKLVQIDTATRPSQIPRKAASFQAMYPGYYLTGLDIDAGTATLTRLDQATVRARDALAVALAVDPWQVGIRPAGEGGFDITVPVTYVPSKHDGRLTEAVHTAIGDAGWWVTVDAKTNRGRIRPGRPPSFPLVVPYPDPPDGPVGLDEQMRLPLGISLARGPVASRPVFLDLSDSAGALIQGTAGSGKSVTINALIAGALERGWQVGVGNVPHKRIDFDWCRPYVHENWYGAASKEATMTVAGLVYAVRDQRTALLAEHGVTKWNDLPSSVRPAPILLVIDELQGLYFMEPVPKGIPGDHPAYHELVEVPTCENVATQRFKQTIRKIAAELRFVGVRLLLGTQQAQGNTGIDRSVKMLFPNRILLGARADEAARGHAFTDPTNAVTVPENIRQDIAMGKGVGVAEIEGEGSLVFKSYYVDTPEEYATRLRRAGLATTATPEPTSDQIADHAPDDA